MPRLIGEMLADAVRREGATARSLDGWGWREFKALPVSWFDGLARIPRWRILGFGPRVWLEGLLDAYIAMILRTDGDATPLGQRSSHCLSYVGICEVAAVGGLFSILGPGFCLQCWGGRSSVEAWYTTALSGLLTLMFIFLLLML